jgi:uncharacterized membrane protein YfcA
LPLKTRFGISHISWMPPVALGVVVGWLTAIMGVGGGFSWCRAIYCCACRPASMGTSVPQIMFAAFTTVMHHGRIERGPTSAYR